MLINDINFLFFHFLLYDIATYCFAVCLTSPDNLHMQLDADYFKTLLVCMRFFFWTGGWKSYVYKNTNAHVDKAQAVSP